MQNAMLRALNALLLLGECQQSRQTHESMVATFSLQSNPAPEEQPNCSAVGSKKEASEAASAKAIEHQDFLQYLQAIGVLNSTLVRAHT